MSPVQSVTYVFGLDRQKMGWTVLPAQNTHTPANSRSFLYTQVFYTIVRKCHKQMIFGERPAELADVETINMQVLDRRRVFLERLENFPLKKAEYYKELQVTTGIKSVRGLSEITGEDWSYIAKVLKTLELPNPILNFIEEHQTPEIIKHFHLKRLMEIVKLESEEKKLLLFRKIFEQFKPEFLIFH